MSQVISIASNPRYRPQGEKPIKRRELQLQIGYGKTKIAEFNAAGMPHVVCRGFNLYYATEVKAWLAQRGFWRYDEGGLQHPDAGRISK